ncbi:transcription antitermination factor NusB [Hydrogenimonas cancrithermarum]|uniref:Transcription antitermination protein NusB n=1 Tax=Hydrogenimonas cancrithermarum TaxID=2993563 RepID=A0ABM8FP79_9BACT|nr:transcription antitermination factor NusB [Hydrogenimonas cancrithermarum]BDY13494.1 N utilization substance protein B [Hydrogenimonas cancrithermarum]
MATRHQSRGAVIGLLYAHDIGNPEVQQFSEDLLEEKKIRNKQREFALGLYNGVLEHLGTIDEEIKEHLKDWDFDRLDHVDKSILRLGTYELLYTDLDRAVIINEAVELAKELGSDQSPKFVNGVLDAIEKTASRKDEKA